MNFTNLAIWAVMKKKNFAKGCYFWGRFFFLNIFMAKKSKSNCKGQIKPEWIYEIMNFLVGILEIWWFHIFIIFILSYPDL